MSKLARHSRRPRPTRGTVLAAIGSAIAIHAALIGSVNVFGADLVGAGLAGNGSATGPSIDPETPLETKCTGNVLLATTARAALCLAPWRQSVEGCRDDVETQMWMDLSACRVGTEPLAEVSMVQPHETEKLIPIDPEQLLEEAAQLQQQQPTPPPELQPPQPAPPPPPPPPAPQRPQQVIETVAPNDEQEPDNARFLAEYNTRVDKQKVARGARNEPMVNQPKPEELTPTPKPPEEPPSAKPPETERDVGRNERAPDKQGPLAMRKPGAVNPNETPQVAHQRGANDGTNGPSSQDGYQQRRGDGQIDQQQRDPGEQTHGQGGAGGGAPRLPDLNKSKEVLERIAGGGSVDHLEDVEEGDETSLTAKKWVYASFFNRLKRQVAQNWDPQGVWRRVDPDGTHYGYKTRVTEVRVSLDGKGALKAINVTSPSDVSALDDEALRAFHASAPFPNPPEGLVGKNGLITFAFSFYFEIGSPRTSWRVIRQ